MTYALPQSVRASVTGATMVLLNIESGQYYELNESAACMVEALLDGELHDAIARRISARFEVTEATATSDLARLVSELEQLGLLTE